ncbi:MAG: hypothetical protein J0M25_11955 [Flavobacteriales bacterium]|nr:hypothetical protein [Flavobacteriales bacterium]
MKKFFLIPLLFGIFMLNVASTCSNDDDSNDDDDSSSSTIITQTQNTIVNGAWRVTLFSEDGSNQTSQFSNYDFVFGTNGTITANNGSNTMNGSWTTGTDDSTPKFIINFSVTNGPFEEISEDWQILSTTSTKIELKHVSGGDGSIDLLTFEKN